MYNFRTAYRRVPLGYTLIDCFSKKPRNHLYGLPDSNPGLEVIFIKNNKNKLARAKVKSQLLHTVQE